MGQISKGILGPVSGTVGTVIGATWKGISYLRSQPNKRKRTSTVNQIDQQLKFAVVMSFLQTMVGVLQLTFKKYANKMSEVNAAFSYNYHNAITGTSPDYVIDYPNALVSHGDLPNATAPAATATANTVHYTWTDNSGSGSALATDQAVLVVYCAALNLTIFNSAAAARSAAAATLNVADFAGQTVQTWIAFLSEDGKEASNSTFTGELTIS
jgi:hypothetical protein